MGTLSRYLTILGIPVVHPSVKKTVPGQAPVKRRPSRWVSAVSIDGMSESTSGDNADNRVYREGLCGESAEDKFFNAYTENASLDLIKTLLKKMDLWKVQELVASFDYADGKFLVSEGMTTINQIRIAAGQKPYDMTPDANGTPLGYNKCYQHLRTLRVTAHTTLNNIGFTDEMAHEIFGQD